MTGNTSWDAQARHQVFPFLRANSRSRSATLAWVWPQLNEIEQRVSKDLGKKVAIWLTEFNWAGPSKVNMIPPERDHGALHGMLWVAYVLSAISVTQLAVADGRTGFDALNYYALFRQASRPRPEACWVTPEDPRTCSQSPSAHGPGNFLFAAGTRSNPLRRTATESPSYHHRVTWHGKLSHRLPPRTPAGKREVVAVGRLREGVG